jgi:hypothetical protein
VTFASRRLRRFVVAVETIDDAGDVAGLGTGFFVAPGRVLTAAHVVSGLDRVLVRPADPAVSDTAVPAQVAARSAPPVAEWALWPFPDLAVLRLDENLDHPCVRLAAVDPAGDADCHSWGYPQRSLGAHPLGEPAMFGFEGVDRAGFLQLRQGLARPGLSGAPLVCPVRRAVVGVITASRDIGFPLGGWAAPMAALLDGGPGVPDDLAAVGSRIALDNSMALLDDHTHWDRVFQDDVEDDLPPAAEESRRAAYRLGAAIGLLTLLEAGPPGADAELASPDRAAAVESHKRRCRKLCAYLSVPFPSASPTSSVRVERITYRIQEVRGLHELITRQVAKNAGAAFRLGFEILLAAEMVPFLPAEQKLDSVRRNQALAEAVGAPPEIVDRMTTLFTTTPDRDAMLTGAFDLNDQLSRWFDSQQDPGDPRARREQLPLWQFCGHAARAAITLSHGGSPDSVDAYVRKARRDGDDLSPPPLFDLSDDEPTNHAMALHYILDELPKSVTSQADGHLGPGSSHLLKLCTRLWALPIVYHPEEDTGPTIASVLQTESEALKIPPGLWEPLVTAIRHHADYATVRDLVPDLDRTITEYLAEQCPP